MNRPQTQSTLKQAIHALEQLDHWTLKTINLRGERLGYSCTIWDDGRKVSAHGATTLSAVTKAINLIHSTPQLRVHQSDVPPASDSPGRSPHNEPSARPRPAESNRSSDSDEQADRSAEQ